MQIFAIKKCLQLKYYYIINIKYYDTRFDGIWKLEGISLREIMLAQLGFGGEADNVT